MPQKFTHTYTHTYNYGSSHDKLQIISLDISNENIIHICEIENNFPKKCEI